MDKKQMEAEAVNFERAEIMDSDEFSLADVIKMADALRDVRKFAFVSRHEPTQQQRSLAAQQGALLVEVGDMDAFEITSAMVDEKGVFDGVVVVHPSAALRLAPDFVVGVFKNANRAPVGDKPQFVATEFHTYDLKR